MIWNAFVIAFRQIYRNLLRSFLTMLGIIIGIASVVSMVNFGKATTKNITQSISNLGSNLLIVFPSRALDTRGVSVGKKNFSQSEVDFLHSRLQGEIAYLSALSSSIVLAQYLGRSFNTTLNGVGEEYLLATNTEVKSGRDFYAREFSDLSRVCIIGESVKKELYAQSNPLGSNLRVGNIVCEVIGVLKAKGQGAMGQDQDDVILMPIKTYNQHFNTQASLNNIRRIFISLKEGVDSVMMTQKISSLLRDLRNTPSSQRDPFEIMDTKEILNTINSTTQTMTIFITAIAGISLLVGGIGIMNMMLVSVTERTKEIGIRIAIGASRGEVLLQFLIESVVLSLVGGVVGVLLSVGATFALINYFDMEFVFEFDIVLYALVFSIFIGVLFGYLPARRASKLNPIDALRHE